MPANRYLHNAGHENDIAQFLHTTGDRVVTDCKLTQPGPTIKWRTRLHIIRAAAPCRHTALFH